MTYHRIQSVREGQAHPVLCELSEEGRAEFGKGGIGGKRAESETVIPTFKRYHAGFSGGQKRRLERGFDRFEA